MSNIVDLLRNWLRRRSPSEVADVPGDFKIAQIRPRGMNGDLSPAPDFWYYLNNLPERDGLPRTPGPDGAQGPTSAVSPLISVAPGFNDLATRTFMAVGVTAPLTTAVYTFGVGGAATTLTTPGGWDATEDKPQRHTACTINGKQVINNAGGDPIYYPGTGTAALALPNLPTNYSGFSTCAALRSYREFLVMMRMSYAAVGADSVREDEVVWSDRATGGTVPATWIASATNEAGDAVLGDTPGALVDGLQLGDYFMIYKGEACYRMQEVGLPTVMGIRRANVTEGVFGRNCIVNVNNRHYVVGNSDIYETDGQSSKSIITGQMRKWFYNNAELGLNDYVFACLLPNENEFMVCFRQSGTAATYPDTALVYNGARWSVRDLGQQHVTEDADDGFSYAFSFDGDLYACNPDSSTNRANVLRLEEDSTPDNPLGVARCGGIELIPGRRPLLKRIRVTSPDGADLEVKVVASDVNERDNWDTLLAAASAQTANGSGDNWLSVDALGAFAAVEIAVNNTATSIDGFELEYVDGTRY